MFRNVRLAFETILENLRKSSESGRKSSENRQKRRHQFVYIVNITRELDDMNSLMNFMLSWQEQYLKCERSVRVRYCSCRSNIKFIFSRNRVISSIYFTLNLS